MTPSTSSTTLTISQIARVLAGGVLTLLALICITAGITVLAVMPGIAPNYYLFMPGPPFPVAPMIEVPAERQHAVGELSFTVVYEMEADFIAAVRASIRPGFRVVPYERVIPDGVSVEESNRLSQQMMNESQLAAQVVALGHAGYNVRFSGDGVRIASILPDSPAAKALRVDDVILAQDGEPVQTAVELIEAIRRRQPGDEVTLTVRRDGQLEEIRVGTVPAPDQPSIPRVGASIETVNPRTDLPFPVEVESGGAVGPSAGLMFALGIYDAITPGQLGGGVPIAGTGTLGADGRVGPVDGIAQKVIGAQQHGARVFLAPHDNAEEAQSAAATTIQIIAIESFDEALAAIQALSADN